MVELRCVHLIAKKHVMRYLKGTIDLGLYYGRDNDYNLYGYTDSNWARSAANRKSTLGRFYCLGSTMISWFSKKQSNVALSTTEAEYIAAYSASWEAIWLWKTNVRTILHGVGYHSDSL